MGCHMGLEARHARLHPRAMARPRVDRNRAAEQPHPFLHAQEPQAAGAPGLVDVKAVPLVGDGQPQIVAFSHELDARGGRMTVTDDVVQRLLNDSVQTERDVGRQIRRIEILIVKEGT